LVAIEKLVTEATIVSVSEDDRHDWKLNIDADIPALGNKTFRYMTWRKSQGDPPGEGMVVLATLNPRVRSNYYVKNGTYADNIIDGTENPWEIDWNFEGWDAEPGEDSPKGVPIVPSPRTAPPTATSIVPATFVDKDRAVRIREQNVNDREAVRLAIELGKIGNDGENVFTVAGALEAAGVIADWLNTRLDARLAGGLVGMAQDAGATLTSVSQMMSDADHPLVVAPEAMPPQDVLLLPQIRNLDALREWAKEQEWTPAAVIKVINEAGFPDSASYVAEKGNTAQGLAEILYKELHADEFPW